MTKFIKGNVYAFKRKNVPQNKGVRKPKAENLPAPYIDCPRKWTSWCEIRYRPQSPRKWPGDQVHIASCILVPAKEVNKDVNKSNK